MFFDLRKYSFQPAEWLLAGDIVILETSKHN